MKYRLVGLFLLWLACVLPAAAAEKPWLLFEIEEGFHEEMIYLNRDNPAAMDAGLNNIVNALAPLSAQYNVAVLIYPVSLYDRNAFGKANPQPIDCLHAGLRHALQYFESRYDASGVGVFLEAISSGNMTKQDGTLYSHTPAPLHNTPGAPGVPALAIDCETLAAARAASPKSLKGIRFHETHYTFDLQGNRLWGYPLALATVQGLTDTLRDSGMMLVWNNSVWLTNIHDVRDQGYLPYVDNGKYQATILAEPYKTMQDYAAAQLGPARFIMTQANNSYHTGSALNMLSAKAGAPLYNYLWFDLKFPAHPIKSYPGAGWGVSDQSWFWTEAQNTVGGKYYAQSEMFCPVEMPIAYSLEALRQGARLIQYEPPWYFFNNGLTGTPADGAERDSLRRLRDALLTPDEPLHPPADPLFFFSDTMQRTLENRAANPAALYDQETLWLRTAARSELRDFYVGKRQWLAGRPARMIPALTDGSNRLAARLCVQGNSLDLIALSRPWTADYDQLFYYDLNGRFLVKDQSLLIDNANGKAVEMAGANLIQEIKGEGDPDELVLARAGAAGEIKLEICKITTYSIALKSFSIKYNPAQTLATTFPANQFLGLTGLRTSVTDQQSALNPLDRLVVLTADGSARQVKIHVLDRTGATLATKVLAVTCAGARAGCAALDIDRDRQDELLLYRRTDEGAWIDAYRLAGSSIEWVRSQQMEAAVHTSAQRWDYP